MDSTKGRTVTVRKKNTSDRSHRSSDLLGIGALAAALVIGIALALGNAGFLGDGLREVFSTLFGSGAWAAPAVLAIFGTVLLAGRHRLELGRAFWGATLLFLALVAALARTRGGDYFDPDAAQASGGYVGAAVAWLFETLLGKAKPVGIGALGMIGIVLCLDSPLRSFAAILAERATSTVKLKKNPERPLAESKAKKIPKEAVVRMTEAPSSTTTKRVPITYETKRPSQQTTAPEPKEGYEMPSLGLLAEPHARPKRTASEMQKNIETLEGTLEEFKIEANVVEVATGPTITRYEIQLGPGIRVARITALADNIAMNLAASHVRVEAPIPGKAAIGVEVPNAQRIPVSLRELCDTKEFVDHPSKLLIGLGQDVSGVNQYADLTKMPHLLIGGATNSGKSIGLAAIIMSLLVRNTPKDCKLVLIDPKRVELTLFDGIPHLMCPVVRDVKDAPGVLRAVWREMDRRYHVFSEAGVRNIDSWNEKASFNDRMSYIVVVIDELADLMIQASAEVETSICRLAQLARAVGIHLVIATQRPSVDVITGTIKANIASRIAFSVSSQVDSRTILDQAGAERLVGRGDMLFMPIDASKPTRIQGCYVSEKEIEAVCAHWKAQEKPHYVLNPIEIAIADREAEIEEGMDELWEDVVRWVVDRGQASTSMIQRRFAIGFQRASRILDMMEERQIVGPRDGPRPREVLISPMEVDVALGKRARVSTMPAFDIEESD